MNYFIKLPDGTIINVRYVRQVETIATTHNADGSRNWLTRVYIGQEYPDGYSDPGHKIYEYFNSISSEIGG